MQKVDASMASRMLAKQCYKCSKPLQAGEVVYKEGRIMYDGTIFFNDKWLSHATCDHCDCGEGVHHAD